MIRKHTRRAAKAAFAISFGVAIILGGATTAGAESTATQTPIIVGTKNFGEAFVLGQLYKQALEAKGFKVSYKENIGSTELIQKALTSGRITLYPEYIGIALTVTFKQKTFPASAAATYAAREEALRGQGLHRDPHDAVPGRRCGRGAPLDREPVQAEDGGRPEEGALPDARSLPRVPHPADGAARDRAGLRGERRRLHAACGHQCLQAARRQEGAWPRGSSRPTRRSRPRSTPC